MITYVKFVCRTFSPTTNWTLSGLLKFFDYSNCQANLKVFFVASSPNKVQFRLIKNQYHKASDGYDLMLLGKYG